MRKLSFIVAFSIIIHLVPNITEAQFWGAKSPRPMDTPKDSLKKGEFTWAPEISPKGPVLVTVSLDDQLAYTYRNGVLIGIATISTGKKGHETPTGVFHTIMKDAKHRSSKYNNASMPYTQKFTQYGIALHAGGLPGYPSSHGCVHLPSEYARLLFNETPLGMTVVVTNQVKFPEAVDHPAFLSPVMVDGKQQVHERLSSTEKYRWTPEKSTEGPVTMLMSRTDKRMVVLRNGIEIGRTKIEIANEKDSIGTIVYVAQAKTGVTGTIAGQNIQWLSHDLKDSNYGKGIHNDPQKQLARIKIPDAFVQDIQPLIVEGTTMMVTDAPILRKTTGKDVGVLSSHPGT
jgi:hypothetical protein